MGVIKGRYMAVQRAIIPVAGAGTRLRPHTYVVPKTLLTVADKPILGHILDGVLSAGIQEVVLVVGYKGDQVVEYVRRAYPQLQLRWVVQEEAAGLGHAIWCARQYLDGSPVLIILGDTIVEVDWTGLLCCPDNVVGVHRVDDPRRFGVVVLQDGVVSGFVEKPEEPLSDVALVGLYLIRESHWLREALEELLHRGFRTRGEYQLTDALELMRQRGACFHPFVVEGWYDCGKWETLLETNRHLLARRGNNPRLDGCAVIPPVYIAPTARIEAAVIGPYASVGESATIRLSVLRNTIVNAEAYVEAVVLEGSIIGARAVVQGRAQCLSVADESEVRQRG